MSLYAVVKGEVVDGIAISDSPLDTDGVWILVDNVVPQPSAGWLYENGVFSPPPKPPTPPVIDTWVISKVAMISRFTPQEYVGIVGATKTDVEVQAWYDLFQAASRVDLKDQRTVSGINSLVGKNLLTQARADTILTTPAQPNEIPS
jgi:hypothetical protein